MPQEFVVLLPVKPPASGKSRLRGLTDRQRRDLAGAFALDTATACLAADRVAHVLVTTDDAAFARRLADLGCDTVPDGDGRGLNPVLVQTAAVAGRRWPHLRPVALLGDLPALRAEELDGALAVVAEDDGPAFVADADGVGTTLYSAPTARFAPRFGTGSRAAHAESGARDVAGDWPTLRRDVDETESLRAAVALGVGPATAAVLADVDLAPGQRASGS